MSKQHSAVIRDLTTLPVPLQMEVRHWRNQEFVRNNMVDNMPISEEQHAAFLEKLKTDQDRKVFVLFFDEEPAAVMTMKFDREKREIESGSYLIAEDTQGSGLGVILGYARMEYIFRAMPDGVMRTFVLQHNQKNDSLQRSFGCEFVREMTVQKSDGTSEKANVYRMTREQWEERKGRISRAVSRLVPIENITLTGETL
ncbi:MAG: hypothetical protein IJJ38_06270 [Lachnospiraceae bacterium]|nr:hypothetical protein [Lachnospiraceae bacterium]